MVDPPWVKRHDDFSGKGIPIGRMLSLNRGHYFVNDIQSIQESLDFVLYPIGYVVVSMDFLLDKSSWNPQNWLILYIEQITVVEKASMYIEQITVLKKASMSGNDYIFIGGICGKFAGQKKRSHRLNWCITLHDGFTVYSLGCPPSQ